MVLDVGPAAGSDGAADEADLAVFVDRIAAAGSDEPTSRARERIRRDIADGETPPGLRRLAEALAASVAERTPAPRRPAEDASTVVAAVRGTSLLVFEDVDDAGIAASVGALVADGRRVVVAAETAAELERLRAALPGPLTDRVLDDLPGQAPADVRELRRLLATSTATRRARVDQRPPAPDVLPGPDEIAELCARAAGGVAPTAGAGLVPHVLARLDTFRLDAVTSVARHVQRSLAAMHPRTQMPWAWDLLGELIYGGHRPDFDQLREDTAQAMAALERARTLPSVAISGPLPGGALDALRRYAEFLTTSGRRPTLRRPAVQREVMPALRVLRVGGRSPETALDLQRIVEHLELGERLARIDRGCYALGIPAPRDEAELARLADGIVRVAAAARAVGGLRHDVLFLGEGSPLSVPDLDAAEQVAAAILDYAEHGSPAESAERLDRLADALEDTVPDDVRAPEHRAAVRALRDRDAAAYAVALDGLDAARHEAQDEQRQSVLLDQLAAHSPRLAAAWAQLASTDPAALGFACLRTAEALLTTLAPPDSADVVVALSAHRLGVERLLLAAVAPRLVAVVPTGAEPEAAPTMLSVLQRASALVIRGRPGPPRVLPIAPQPRPAPARMGQAGA